MRKNTWDTSGLDEVASPSQDKTPSVKKNNFKSPEPNPINSDDSEVCVSRKDSEYNFNAMMDDGGSRVGGGRGSVDSNRTEFMNQSVGIGDMSHEDQSPMERSGSEDKIDRKSPHYLGDEEVEQGGKKVGVVIPRSRFSSNAIVRVGAGEGNTQMSRTDNNFRNFKQDMVMNESMEAPNVVEKKSTVDGGHLKLKSEFEVVVTVPRETIPIKGPRKTTTGIIKGESDFQNNKYKVLKNHKKKKIIGQTD
jgi:hypothetical protein